MLLCVPGWLVGAEALQQSTRMVMLYWLCTAFKDKIRSMYLQLRSVRKQAKASPGPSVRLHTAAVYHDEEKCGGPSAISFLAIHKLFMELSVVLCAKTVRRKVVACGAAVRGSPLARVLASFGGTKKYKSIGINKYSQRGFNESFRVRISWGCRIDCESETQNKRSRGYVNISKIRRCPLISSR